MYRSIGAAAFLLFCCWGRAVSSEWKLAADGDLEVYSGGDADSALRGLSWFAQMRALADRQPGLPRRSGPPLRIVAFRSVREFRLAGLHDSADAFYVANGAREYIVMPSLEPDQFGIAAHEYAHALVHAAGGKLPVWLGEGLAEVASTLRIANGSATYGGEHPRHVRVVRERPMTLAELLAVTPSGLERGTKEFTGRVYAHAWALTAMLALAPEYNSRFEELLRTIAGGADSAEALRRIYGKGEAAISSDLHKWTERCRNYRGTLGDVGGSARHAGPETISPARADLLLGELHLSRGQAGQATAAYKRAADDPAAAAEAWAGLGTVALTRNDRDAAREAWKKAITLGIRDAGLCYRYALLMEEAGASEEDVRPVLIRALDGDPAFDGARFHLALIESNAGRYESAVHHLRLMHVVAPSIAYSWWSTMANALTELGQRDEGREAAHRASSFAVSAEQRARAAQLAYMAETELAVQFRRDGSGRTQLVTTRKRRDAPPLNPFIEPGDDIHHVEATLEEIWCGVAQTGVTLRSEDRSLRLEIADTSRVLMRNAPAEFTCGPQPSTEVVVDYAARVTSDSQGVVRGIEFRPAPAH